MRTLFSVYKYKCISGRTDVIRTSEANVSCVEQISLLEIRGIYALKLYYIVRGPSQDMEIELESY